MEKLFDELCTSLGLNESPPVLLSGEEAIRFARNHYNNRNKNSSLKRVNAMFLYENLDEKYVQDNNIDKRCFDNGVICLIRCKESSLAHEMRHAYQLMNNEEYMFLEKNKELWYEYKRTYPYYPSEQDAFTYAIDFLKGRITLAKNGGDSVLSSLLKTQLARSRHVLYKLNYIGLKIEYFFKDTRHKNS